MSLKNPSWAGVGYFLTPITRGETYAFIPRPYPSRIFAIRRQTCGHLELSGRLESRCSRDIEHVIRHHHDKR